MTAVASAEPKTRTAPPAGQPGRGSAIRAAAWARRLPLLPALIFLFIVTQLPFLITIGISFMSWNALYPNDVHFAWFENYANLFSNDRLRSSILVTIVLTLVVVIISAVLGLLIALLLDRKFLGRGIVRTIMIAPFLVVPVAAALVWKHALLNPTYGLFNGILTVLFGANAPQLDWIQDSPLLSIELALIWQWTPFMMLILLAGLQSRPLDVIEAARVDGATAWQIFRYMTFPHLRQYLELAITLGAIYIVQNFDAVFTITSGGLGTANLPYTIYQQFFVAKDYGGASAAGVIVVIGTIAIATFALRSVSGLLKEENA